MGYSEREDMVRIDFFKESGKWYCTEAVKWIGYNGAIQNEFAKSLRHHFGEKKRLEGMRAVCLEPYNQHSCPLMLKVSSIWEEKEQYLKLEW